MKNKRNNYQDIYSKNEFKQNSKIKWIVIAIVLITVISITIGITMFANSPKYTVLQAFKSLKNGNTTEVSKYLNYKNLIAFLDDKIETGSDMSELEKNCFNSLKYTINKETINGDKATVEIVVTNKNFRNALNNWIKKVYQNQINGQETTDEQSKKLLNTYLQDNTIGTLTVTKTINLEKTNKKWQIVIDENLENAVFPGLRDMINSVDMLLN